MILRDAIKYMELNKSDFITDLNDFADLQKDFQAEAIPDNFTELYEGFIDKLFTLWVENEGGIETALKTHSETPKANDLIKKYCRITFVSEQAKKDEGKTFFKSKLLVVKKEENKENQTLELLTFLGANDIDISQFLDMEIDVVHKVISIIADKKKEEEEKRKKKKRGL